MLNNNQNSVINLLKMYFTLLADCYCGSLSAANKYAAFAAPRVTDGASFLTAIIGFLFITQKGRWVMSELRKELFKLVLSILAMIPMMRMLVKGIFMMGLRYLIWERRGCMKSGYYGKFKGMYRSYILFTIARIKKAQQKGISKAA